MGISGDAPVSGGTKASFSSWHNIQHSGLRRPCAIRQLQLLRPLKTLSVSCWNTSLGFRVSGVVASKLGGNSKITTVILFVSTGAASGVSIGRCLRNSPMVGMILQLEVVCNVIVVDGEATDSSIRSVLWDGKICVREVLRYEFPKCDFARRSGDRRTTNQTGRKRLSRDDSTLSRLLVP